MIENKTKIWNLLGLENPGIRFLYEFAYSLQLVTLMKKKKNYNATKLKQTNKQNFQNAEANCKTFPIKTSFSHEPNYNHFYINIFALSFA